MLGLELAEVHRPDLILLDISLPGMDGYQLLECLQTNPELSTMPVVAISANAMPRDIERGKAAGFHDYITKPIDLNRLLQVVDEVLAPAGDGD
jgi:CheY-like chemotaxis protein